MDEYQPIADEDPADLAAEPAEPAELDGPGLRASLEELPDLAPFLPDDVDDVADGEDITREPA